MNYPPFKAETIRTLYRHPCSCFKTIQCISPSPPILNLPSCPNFRGDSLRVTRFSLSIGPVPLLFYQHSCFMVHFVPFHSESGHKCPFSVHIKVIMHPFFCTNPLSLSATVILFTLFVCIDFVRLYVETYIKIT